LRLPSRENYAEQISLFERALALDPQSVEGQSRLAIVLAGRVANGLTDSVAADLARAEGPVGQALAASPRYAYGHHTKATVLRAQSRCEEAVPEYETALALNRNQVYAIIGLGWCRIDAGSPDEAIPLAEQAIRLSPRDPGVGWWYGQIGTAHLLQSRTDDAILWLERARTAVPAVPAHHSRLASAYALKGDIERAAAELTEAHRLAGDDRYSSIARMRAGGCCGRRKPAPCTKPLFWPGCGRPACRRNEMPPPSALIRSAMDQRAARRSRQRHRYCASPM